MAARDDSRTDLGRALRDLRNDAGLTQLAVVARTDISQTQLSRIELGASLPTEEQASELARLYGLDAPARARLVQRVKDARAGVRDDRLVIQRGSTLAMQQRWRRLESESTLVRTYQPAVVPGVLQTAAYASVVMRQPESSDSVRDRMARHRRLLEHPPPHHVVILTEGALLLCVGSAGVMAGQIGALIEASRRPHVKLGVIPTARPVNRVTTNAFHLYGDAIAVVGVEVAAAVLGRPDKPGDPDDVAHFEELFAELERLAVVDDEARTLLGQIARRYRQR